MRLAAKVDKNQKGIVKALRLLGYHVTLLHRLGKGVPDILVAGYSFRYGVVALLLVELKTEEGELTEAEKKWHEEFRASFLARIGETPPDDDLPLLVASTLEEILDWFGRGI
jgi:hypothetical protein